MPQRLCEYRIPGDTESCCREAEPNADACYFHLGSDSEGEFGTRLQALIDSKENDWRGFKFPPGFNLSDRSIDFDVRLNHATFFGETLFEKVAFLGRLDLSNAHFDGPVRWSAVKCRGEAVLERCRFSGPVQDRGDAPDGDGGDGGD